MLFNLIKTALSVLEDRIYAPQKLKKLEDDHARLANDFSVVMGEADYFAQECRRLDAVNSQLLAENSALKHQLGQSE
jgi:hypothetical protein